MMVRGNVGIEIRQIGTDWLGCSRIRLWSSPLEKMEDAETRNHYSVYRIHLCLFVIGVHPPAGLRNAFIRAFGVDW